MRNKNTQNLSRVMQKRRQQIDAKLLTHAVQQTAKIEMILCKRFPPKAPESPPLLAGTSTGARLGPVLPITTKTGTTAKRPTANIPRSFEHIIRPVFEDYMDIYIEQQDKNLNDFINQCVQRFRDGADRPNMESTTIAPPLPSSSSLFEYYKRVIQDSHQLSTNPQKLLLELAVVLKKYLREYSCRSLLAILAKTTAATANTPGATAQQTATSMLSAAAGSAVDNSQLETIVVKDNAYSIGMGLFQSLLPPAVVRDGGGEPIRLSKEDQFLTCCVLATADFCAETTHQMQEKLKERLTDPAMQAKLDVSAEQEQFYNASNNALLVLAQDLEAACDAALLAMTKINWSTKEAVGDESNYVRNICQHLKTSVPLLREYLAERRKYFGHLCVKFAQQFMTKYLGTLFRCKPCSISGAEQLLLDTHALKTFLLTLPSIGSSVAPKPPVTYTKQVTKGMSKAEMVLKVVMAPIDSTDGFVDQYVKLLPDSDATELQKVLEMKAIRRTDQAPLIERYRQKTDSYAANTLQTPTAEGNTSRGSPRVIGTPASGVSPNASASNLALPIMSLAGGLDADSRINKLQRLVKKKL